MSRLPRNYTNTPFFHVITQGIEKSYIFEKAEDIKYYVKIMYKIKEEHNINIIAYCIMNNHTHMLAETKSIEQLSKYMQRINTTYGKYYNKKYSRVGYVFRDRYKAEGIYSEKHLYNCIKYIYNNPVKAGICNKPEEYPYSNYKMMKTKLEEKYKSIINYENNKEKYVFIDVDEKNNVICNEILEKYLKENRTDLKTIKQSKEMLKQLILFFKDENKISLRKIAEEIEISRETVRKIYNQQKNNY